jgi:hypothetical protein
LAMSSAAAAETAYSSGRPRSTTALAERLVKVQFAFVRDLGIYYVL